MQNWWDCWRRWSRCSGCHSSVSPSYFPEERWARDPFHPWNPVVQWPCWNSYRPTWPSCPPVSGDKRRESRTRLAFCCTPLGFRPGCVWHFSQNYAPFPRAGTGCYCGHSLTWDVIGPLPQQQQHIQSGVVTLNSVFNGVGSFFLFFSIYMMGIKWRAPLVLMSPKAVGNDTGIGISFIYVFILAIPSMITICLIRCLWALK